MLRDKIAFSFAALCLVCLCLVSCAPRGETNSLDQILESARTRYLSLGTAGVAPEVGKSLKSIATSLADLEKPLALPQYAQKSTAVAELLAALNGRAGYTSRASLAELASQYRGMASQANQGSSIDAKAQLARTRLLVARTYNLLASELETTGFALG